MSLVFPEGKGHDPELAPEELLPDVEEADDRDEEDDPVIDAEELPLEDVDRDQLEEVDKGVARDVEDDAEGVKKLEVEDNDDNPVNIVTDDRVKVDVVSVLGTAVPFGEGNEKVNLGFLSSSSSGSPSSPALIF